MSRFLTVIFCVVVVFGATIHGQVPGLISYQGKLLDASGDPVTDGSYAVEFRLWRDAVSIVPADELWTSNLINVSTVDGLFSIILGQSPMPSIDPFLFVADTNVWLGIKIGSDPEMSPRTRMTGIGYTMFSQYAWQSHLSDSATGADRATELITPGAIADDVLKWNGSAWVPKPDAGSAGEYVLKTGDTMTGYLIFNALGNETETEMLFGPNWSWLKMQTADSLRTQLINWDYGQLEIYDHAGHIAVDIEGTPDGVYGGGKVVVFNNADYGNPNWTGELTGGVGAGSLYLRDSAGNYNLTLQGGAMGDNLVILPDSAVNSDEMSNEPGLASDYNASGVFLTTTMQDIVTVTITIPEAGYISLTGKCYVDQRGTTGSNFSYLQIVETGGGVLDFPYYQQFGSNEEPTSTTIRVYPVSTQRVYAKVAGTYTFRLEALNTAAAGGNAMVWDAVLTAIYYPTSYGAVIAKSDGSDLEGFDQFSQETVTRIQPDGSEKNEIIYRVDLRSLELKAKQARIIVLEALHRAKEAEDKLNEARKMSERKSMLQLE